MVELIVDGVICSLIDERVVLPGYSSNMLLGVNAWREKQSVELKVAKSVEVERLLGYADDLHRASNFNDTEHSAIIKVDGVEMFDGKALFRGFDGEGYRLEVRREASRWAHDAALTSLGESDLECDIEMSVDGVERSWSGGDVAMLPLRRDSYPKPAATGLYVTQEMLMAQDYFPFISVRAVLQSIVGRSGYTLHGDFLNSELVARLMLSGAYRNIRTEAVYSQMGFKAMRRSSTSAVADDAGRVDVCAPAMASNVGAIVDTVDPDVEDEDGEPLSEAYSRGGCFRFESGRPKFIPTREVSVAFDINLRFTTDYRITSSKYLKGFDRLYLGNECYVDMALPNPFKDMRDELKPSVAYKLFIFDYDPKLTYYILGYGTITSAVTTVVFDEATASDVKLFYRASQESPYMRYSGDWAIYEGYVSESGRRSVELTVRTPFEKVSPSMPKLFNDIYFEGAEPGQQLTLHSRCSIVPVFSGAPGYGEHIGFKDVANHEISQAELLEAVAHMFNLRIYSHQPSQSLYIEPYDDFYSGTDCDWRNRQMGDVVVEECVVESFAHTKLGYQPSDGAVARLALNEGGDLGTWHYTNSSSAAKQSTDSRLNPLFMPTATYDGLLSTAPSVEILTVGDRDMTTESDSVAPRIVLYHGLVKLPAGEFWPLTSENGSYPLAAFHSTTMGQTLCFEDRDGCQGLHRYYDRELQEGMTRQMVTTEVRLHPEEYVALLDPMSSGATIRSLFRLNVGCASSLFRLDAILDYDTVRHVARCRFQRVLRD